MPGCTNTKSNKAESSKKSDKKCDDSKEPCPLEEEPEYHLHVDADRDGVVDDDRTGIDTWTWGKGKKGAVILCNNDDDAGAGDTDNSDAEINTGNDAKEVAAFEIRRTGPPPPADWEGSLEIKGANRRHVRIFDSHGAGAKEVIGPDKDRKYKLPDLNFTSKTFGIEALRYAGSGFDGEVDVTFKLKKGGSKQTEVARFRVAPWMMPNHLDNAKQVFVVDSGSHNSTFRSRLSTMVSAAGCTLTQHPHSSDIWMQDCMEIGFSNRPKGAGIHAVLRNPRAGGLSTFAETLRKADVGYEEIGVLGRSTFDSTGNLECTPPVKGYPWGRIYFGPGEPGEWFNADFKAMLKKQIVQKPIEIDTNWLLVGHVDEMMSFVPSSGGAPHFKLLLASPKRGYEILDAHKKSGDKLLTGRRNQDRTVSLEVSIKDYLASGVHGYTGAELRKYNEDVQTKIDATRSTLISEGVVKESDIIDLPALFIENHHFPGKADALTAGMVNMLVINKHCIVPKPYGPVVGGTDLFEDDVESKLKPLGLTVKFLDDWYEYHVLSGEVHCGTNTLREPVAADWWEFKP